MSVAATNQSQRHAFYSTTGPTTEIAAPGGDPRDGGPAGRIFQLTLSPADSNELLTFPRFDRYAEVSMQGTSMAAPHVTGVAALLWSRGIRTPAQIESLIRQTALDLVRPERTTRSDTDSSSLAPRSSAWASGSRAAMRRTIILSLLMILPGVVPAAAQVSADDGQTQQPRPRPGTISRSRRTTRADRISRGTSATTPSR